MNENETHCFSVFTGSRLHFGLTRFRPDGNGRLNGVGVMLEHPGTELHFQRATGFQAAGSDRVESFVRLWCHEQDVELPACRIDVRSAPPSHSGLGSGTQLAHATALGLNVILGDVFPPPRVVAERLDRGKRSMIGSFGFTQGGLVIDAPSTGRIACLAHRVPMPDDWRVVLVLPASANKKFGVQEQAAFDSIMAEQTLRSRRLEDLITNQMIPAVESCNFEQFCNSVYEYGRLSGEYYVDVQGGIYNGPVITSVVDSLLRMGAKGIGQSSWGPVVFCWCENQQAANEMLTRINEHFGELADAWITRVRNAPASVTTHPHTEPTPSDR